MGKEKYAYCSFCKKKIEEPIKKPLKPMQKTLWGMGTIATLGIGALGYVIYSGSKRKIYCPICISKLNFSEEPFEKSSKDKKPKTPKEKIYKKAGIEIPDKKDDKSISTGKEEEKLNIEVEKIFCPFCGNQIKKNIKKCPHCKTTLENDERIQE